MVEYQNIDIFMVNRRTKQAIILENKIYAEDQSQQLLRYYLTARREGYKHISIVYLTLSGAEPARESTKGELGDLAKYGLKPICISYRENILSWLQSLIEKSAQIPPLRESLIQYNEIIRELTGMSNNRPLIEQLKKLLLETDSVDVVDNLQEAHFELQTDALVSLWLSLASKMSNELGELTSEDLHNNEVHIRQEVIKYLTDRTGVNHIKVAIPLKGYSDCYLCIQIEWNDALFVGVMNDLSKKNEKLRSFGRKEGYIGDDKWWPMYKYIDYKGEWWHLKKLTPVQIQQLHDEKFVDEFANTLINELRDLKGFIESQS